MDWRSPHGIDPTLGPVEYVNQRYFLWYESVMMRAGEAAFREAVDDQIISVFPGSKINRYANLGVDGKDDDRSWWMRGWATNGTRYLSTDYEETRTMLRSAYPYYMGGANSNPLYDPVSTSHAGDWVTNGRWWASMESNDTANLAELNGSMGWPVGESLFLGPTAYAQEAWYDDYYQNQRDYNHPVGFPSATSCTPGNRDQEHWGAALLMIRQSMESCLNSLVDPTTGAWSDTGNVKEPDDIRVAPWIEGPNTADGASIARTQDVLALLRQKRIPEAVIWNLDSSSAFLWTLMEILYHNTYDPYIDGYYFSVGNHLSGESYDVGRLEDTLRRNVEGTHPDHEVSLTSENAGGHQSTELVVYVKNAHFIINEENGGLHIDLECRFAPGEGATTNVNDITGHVRIWNNYTWNYDEVITNDSSCFTGYMFYSPVAADGSWLTRRTFLIRTVDSHWFDGSGGISLTFVHARSNSQPFVSYYDLVQTVQHYDVELFNPEDRASRGGDGPSQETNWVMAQACPDCSGVAPSLGGDYDFDRDADEVDLAAFLDDWNNNRPKADFNRDGVIDETDFELFEAAWAAMQP